MRTTQVVTPPLEGQRRKRAIILWTNWDIQMYDDTAAEHYVTTVLQSFRSSGITRRGRMLETMGE